MRQFRNPRFAPESLERKLNPAPVVPVPVAAEVYVPAAEAPTLNPASVYASTLANVPTSNPTHPSTPPSSPGAPRPTDVPDDGTDPEPPDGDGDVPDGPPGNPGGPPFPGAH